MLGTSRKRIMQTEQKSKKFLKHVVYKLSKCSNNSSPGDVSAFMASQLLLG